MLQQRRDTPSLSVPRGSPASFVRSGLLCPDVSRIPGLYQPREVGPVPSTAPTVAQVAGPRCPTLWGCLPPSPALWLRAQLHWTPRRSLASRPWFTPVDALPGVPKGPRQVLPRSEALSPNIRTSVQTSSTRCPRGATAWQDQDLHGAGAGNCASQIGNRYGPDPILSGSLSGPYRRVQAACSVLPRMPVS